VWPTSEATGTGTPISPAVATTSGRTCQHEQHDVRPPGVHRKARTMSPDEPTSISESDVDPPSRAMDRRTMIKRTALTAAAFTWAAPSIQVLASRPASAQTAKLCTLSVSSGIGDVDLNLAKWAWFHLQMKGIKYPAGSRPVTLRLVDQQITWVRKGLANVVIPVPNSTIVITNAVTAATSTSVYSAGQWYHTVAQDSDFHGAGAAVRLPPGGTGGTKGTVTWRVTFLSDTVTEAGFQFAGAAFKQSAPGDGPSYATADLTLVKPVTTDSSNPFISKVGAPAGWGEHHPTDPDQGLKDNLVGGLFGGGGSNYVGSWTGTKSCKLSVDFQGS
jgi:hypothetical protein